MAVVSSCRESKISRPLLEIVLKNLAHFGEVRLFVSLMQGNTCILQTMDNAEGSRVISRVFTTRKKMRLQLNNRQMSIVLGSVLGDAYISSQGKICFEQSNAQKEYLFWKYNSLKNLAYPKIGQVIRQHPKTNSISSSWRFFLRQYFRPLRKTFYNDGQKIVPRSLAPWIDDLLIATWYMDDGYLDRGKYPMIMTESFNTSDNLYLIEQLKHKFDIDAYLTTKNRIRIKSRSSAQFFSLIELHIHKSLNYKLP